MPTARTTLLKKRKLLITILAIDFLLLIAFACIMMNTNPTTQTTTNALNLPQDTQKLQTNTPAPAPQWISDRIGQHGSLTELFSNLNLPKKQLLDILALPSIEKHIGIVKPGQTFYFQISADNQLEAMKVPLKHGATLLIQRDAKGFHAHTVQPSLTQTIAYAGNTIKTNLTEAAKHAGLNPAETANLGLIFADKINFKKDLRPGAHFNVLYQTFYQGDEQIAEGPIVAAELKNRHHDYIAIRFEDKKNHFGYFSPNGHNMKRLFLRAPLHYKRISSYFSYHRMDPILHRIRPHLGIDYAAPRGTPVYAMSDGRIVFKGKKGGYGNALIIAYGEHYRTLYAHLSRYAPHLHVGSQVNKGQRVAFVGDTGWSTGSHLHYGLFIDGHPRNPLKIHLPMGSSIPKRLKHAFDKKADALITELSLREGPNPTS